MANFLTFLILSQIISLRKQMSTKKTLKEIEVFKNHLYEPCDNIWQ